MQLKRVVRQLQRSGVTFRVDGTAVYYRNPNDVVTLEMHEWLRARTRDLIKILLAPTARRRHPSPPRVPLTPCAACGSRSYRIAPHTRTVYCTSCETRVPRKNRARKVVDLTQRQKAIRRIGNAPRCRKTAAAGDVLRHPVVEARNVEHGKTGS